MGGDQGHTAAHAGFKQKRHALLFCQRQQLGAMGGHQLLVAGHHTAAAGKQRLHIRICGFHAADGLCCHGNFRIIQNIVDAAGEQLRVFGNLQHQDPLDPNFLTCPSGNEFGIFLQHIPHAAAHGTEAQDRNVDHKSSPPGAQSLPGTCDKNGKTASGRFGGVIRPDAPRPPHAAAPAGPASLQCSPEGYRCGQ